MKQQLIHIHICISWTTRHFALCYFLKGMVNQREVEKYVESVLNGQSLMHIFRIRKSQNLWYRFLIAKTEPTKLGFSAQSIF